MNIKYEFKRLTKEEYIDFLKRSDLGSQYPKERFEERINKLVNNVNVSLIAVDDNKIVGVLFGLTDFAYWLYITDLGVDRNYTNRHIGSTLIQKAHEYAGGKKDIAIYLVANDKAINFYNKNGFKKSDEVMELNNIDWTPFIV